MNTTRNVALLAALTIGTAVFGVNHSASVAGQATPDTQDKIANAMSAGPAALAKDATILDNAVDKTGKFIVLRQGSNGWFCFPDLSTTPGNDPQCMDQTWLDWNYAYLANKAPNVTEPGIEYMLQGGSDPSNTDPMAVAPAPGAAWLNTPPHIMIVLPGKLVPSGLSTEANTGKPWIMWANTPYQHIMVPVGDGEPTQ